MLASVTIRQVARWLRKEFPVAPGVGKIRLVDYPKGDADTFGETTSSGYIKLNRAYAPHIIRETLLHEWVHARLGWSSGDPHNQAFWIELGRITRAYEHWREDS